MKISNTSWPCVHVTEIFLVLLPNKYFSLLFKFKVVYSSSELAFDHLRQSDRRELYSLGDCGLAQHKNRNKILQCSSQEYSLSESQIKFKKLDYICNHFVRSQVKIILKKRCCYASDPTVLVKRLLISFFLWPFICKLSLILFVFMIDPIQMLYSLRNPLNMPPALSFFSTCHLNLQSNSSVCSELNVLLKMQNWVNEEITFPRSCSNLSLKSWNRSLRQNLMRNMCL